MFETERLSLKVLRRDKEALRRLAAVEGEAMAVVVRRLIRRAAQERGLWRPANGRDSDQPDRQEARVGAEVARG